MRAPERSANGKGLSLHRTDRIWGECTVLPDLARALNMVIFRSRNHGVVRFDGARSLRISRSHQGKDM